jgi:hypothetical protein
MNQNRKNTSSEEYAVASQAILTELLARLAQVSPQMRLVTTTALKAAAIGLRQVADEDGDARRRGVLMRAAGLVDHIHQIAVHVADQDETKSRH